MITDSVDEATSVRLGTDTVEVVKEFCYLGYILCTEGDVSSAVTGRMQDGKSSRKSAGCCARNTFH